MVDEQLDGRRLAGRTNMITILLVILLIMVIGSLPVYPYSRQWGFAPGGLIGTILLVLLIFYLLGYRF